MDELIRFDARSIRDTDLAVLVIIEEEEEVWIPKSVIHDDSDIFEADQEGELVVPEWFAKKNSLI